MSGLSDATLAQLMAMGFDPDQIRACHAALSAQNTPLTIQSATEWMLKLNQAPGPASGSSSAQPAVPPLSLPSQGQGSFEKPMSSGMQLQSPTEHIKSRYDLKEDQQLDMDRYIAKEREEAVKKARERRRAEILAREKVKQRIAEDRRLFNEKKQLTSGATAANVAPPQVRAASSAAQSSEKQASENCRVQVRLPDGGALRNVFPATSTLSDVCSFVSQNKPSLTSIKLVQPFPHKEFSAEEHVQTLKALGLCPSVSLVVKKETEEPFRPLAVASSPPDPPAKESGEEEESMDVTTSTSGVARPQGPPVDPADSMEEDEEDEDEEEKMEGYQPHPHMPRPRLPPPHPFRPPGAVVQPRPQVFPPGFPAGRQLVGQGMEFSGEGHRLGGKESMAFGDAQARSQHISKSALDAAKKRVKLLSTMTAAPKLSRARLPSLEDLCLRVLSRWSSANLLPSCNHLPPRTAERLISSLAETKQLHPKTMNAFLKCPLQVLVLDNYAYATNQLLEMIRYFPTLKELSLVSCPLITDKSMTQLLPHLPHLTRLNLNGCRQLSDAIFEAFRGGSQLSVLCLSQLKIGDGGVRRLVQQPLASLIELDLSYTAITSTAVSLLQKGTPNLQSLNIESTKVDGLSSLVSLPCLTTLNVSHCPLEGRVGLLAQCHTLQSLSLAEIPVSFEELQLLAELRLHSFHLPERNLFFDLHMGVIAGFPLTSLNLTGYCNVTDVGIGHISNMTSLTELSLSRTRITDEGMVYLHNLTSLRRLTLDNTLITDAGISCISDLTNLEDLSLSDTRLTSQFILDGTLTKLRKLSKLNLVRTYVDDEGLLNLALPALLMLNIDWTCATERVTLESLRISGCRTLETLRNSKIGQPLPSDMQEQDEDPPHPQLQEDQDDEPLEDDDN